MIGRWIAYARHSYPPIVSLVFAVLLAIGFFGLNTLIDRSAPWRPDLASAVAIVTVALDFFLMRAMDDIRDLDYDRVQSPDRPLVRGIVRVPDLLWLYAIGFAVIVFLNLRAAGLAIIAGQLCYAALVLAAHARLAWPSGDRLFLTLLISSPGQIGVHAYLYAWYLRSEGREPDRHGIVAMTILVLASGHLELVKKIVRRPEPGERTYVKTIGLRSTVALAVGAPLLSTALLLASTDLGVLSMMLVASPLVFVAVGLARFARPQQNRWPRAYAALYLLGSLATYFIAASRSKAG